MTHTASATLATTQKLLHLAANERQRITTKFDADLRRIDQQLDADRARTEQLIDHKIDAALNNPKPVQPTHTSHTTHRLNSVLIFVVGMLAGVLLMAIAGPPVG